jgi:glycosyltransferase involved in cell wall biosynthesis
MAVDNDHVLHVVTAGDAAGRYGGPFVSAQRLAEMAVRNNYSVSLFATRRVDDDPPDLPEGIVLTMPVAKPIVRSLEFPTTCSWAALRALHAAVGRAEIVHIAIAREIIPIAALGFALLRRRTTVLQPHGMLTTRTGHLHRLVDVVLRRMVRRAHAIVVLSEVEEARIGQWLRRPRFTRPLPRTRTMGNPVPKQILVRSAVRNLAEVRREAVFIARLHPRKRVLDFANAALYQSDDIEYVVHGPDEGQLEDLRRLCAGSTVLRYEGRLDEGEVERRLAETGVFVMPSANEPWGLVLVTALALGVPVVLAESADLAELVRAHGAGRVVPDGDATSIAQNVSALLADATVYAAASRGAREAAAALDRRCDVESELLNTYASAAAG